MGCENFCSTSLMSLWRMSVLWGTLQWAERRVFSFWSFFRVGVVDSPVSRTAGTPRRCSHSSLALLPLTHSTCNTNITAPVSVFINEVRSCSEMIFLNVLVFRASYVVFGAQCECNGLVQTFSSAFIYSLWIVWLRNVDGMRKY